MLALLAVDAKRDGQLGLAGAAELVRGDDPGADGGGRILRLHPEQIEATDGRMHGRSVADVVANRVPEQVGRRIPVGRHRTADHGDQFDLEVELCADLRVCDGLSRTDDRGEWFEVSDQSARTCVAQLFQV